MKNGLKRFMIAILVIALLLTPVYGGIVAASGPEQQAQFAIPILVANTSFLNVRTGPGAQYTVLVTVVGGTELPVLGIADDRVWYYVSTPVGNGWVNIDYVLPRGDFRNVPLIDPVVVGAPLIQLQTPVTIGLPGQGGGAAQPSSGNYGNATERFRARINVSSVNLRTAPADGAGSIATLFRDEAEDYAIVGRSRDASGIVWVQIVVPDVGTGWVEENKVMMALSGCYRTVLTIVADVVAVTQSPGGDNTGLPVLTPGNEVFLLSISPDNQFVQVELPDGNVGWIPFSAQTTRVGTPSDDCRETGQGGGDTGSGGTVVAPSVPVLALPRVIINTGNQNVRTGPGSQYTVVATVPGGTQLDLLATTTDQVWYLVQGGFGEGWVNSDYVIVRGNLGNVPVISYSEAAGAAQVSAPVAVLAAVSIPLYVAPGTTLGQLGTLNGPVEVAVVARTNDFSWVQLNTAFGYGWVPADQVILRGDTSLIPVVG